MERREAEATYQLRQELDAYAKERSNMQETLKRITEQHQDYVRGFKEKQLSLESAIDRLRSENQALSKECEWAKEQFREAESKLQKAKADLEMLNASNRGSILFYLRSGKIKKISDSAVEHFQKECQRMSTVLNSLELKSTESTQKVTELTEQLKRSKAEAARYRQIAEKMESGLKVSKPLRLHKIDFEFYF